MRAESAVKSAKRIVLDNTKSDGSPDLDRIARALLQHRNTPDSEYGISPAQLVYGRPMRDFLPIRPGDFSPSEVWIDNHEKRELAMRKRIIRGTERWSAHTRDLPQLTPGTRVLIQNQHGAGKIAKRWDKSGMILEHLGFNKYRVKVDGSGRVTDRNRQFLRKFTPLTPSLPGPSPLSSHVTPPALQDKSPNIQHFDSPPMGEDYPAMPTNSIPSSPITPNPVMVDVPSSPDSPSFETPPSSPATVPMSPEISASPISQETPVLPRRLSRVSRPPEKLTYDRNYRQILK